ncbi:MAG: ribonuclease E activity regulator RraA [Woeseia sp.]|nr:ribonuclease E activity regulator RraA [Woeseia sp.]MBT8097214.1 ribonuclease E activity regulator RraA [Woeseia sp.]
MKFSICDLCDEHEDKVQIADPVFLNYGGRTAFGGSIVTIKCHEDNSRVKELVATPGAGKVLIVDGGGSSRRSLLGDQLAAQAATNGWAGFVIYGALRDVEVLADLDIGIKALSAIPLKTVKRGLGDRDVPVRFAGATFTPGAHVYGDLNGLIVSDRALVQ